MKRITDLAKERTELQLQKEVRGMSYEQREVYLSEVARVIDEMLKDHKVDKYDNGFWEGRE